MSFAKTPEPPYYAVIFTSQRTDVTKGYDEMGEKMMELASQQPGFLGVESVQNEQGYGIMVSYWESLESIRDWKEHALHKVAQDKGKADWYESFVTRVSKVERVTLSETKK